MGETMSVKSENNKRIAKNTFLLYFRMLFTMGVSLYTSRVVLNTLGVEDFGIYNVVGGVVVMFSFLNSSLATATQRFLNYEMGQGNALKLEKVCQHPVGNSGGTHARSIVGIPIFNPDPGRFDHQRPV